MATAIENVRVFDGTQTTAATAVRIDGAHISAVGSGPLAHPGDTVIDGRGGTLLPGLIDAHVHLLPGAPRQAMSFGVTTLLDMFSQPPLVDTCADQGRGGAGADVYSSTIGATAPGGHPSMMYAPFPTLESPSGAAAFVAERAAEGARFLKLFYEGGHSIDWPMPSLDLATVEALAAAAHGAGMLAVAHAHSAADAVAVVEHGADVLAHAPSDPLSAEQLAVLAERATPVISTLAVADGFPATGAPMPLLADPALSGLLGPAWAEVLRGQADRWMPPAPPDFAGAAHNVRRLHEAGCPVLAGTDAPNPGTVHGASLHRELGHLVRAGLSPEAALAAATGAPAQVFGLTGRGVIRPGARADLLLTGGRPDAGIAASAQIAGVWKDGHRWTGSYPGSAAEADGIAHLREQTDAVIAAVTRMLPDGVFAPEKEPGEAP